MSVYNIHTSKIVAGESEKVPMLTLSTKKAALKKMRELIAEYEKEFNIPIYRTVGADVNLFLFKCQTILGGVQDSVAEARIWRSINSPKAMVFLRGELKEKTEEE
jgi:hypothetical protein